ncbi:helix-turn-helix domain-containing protein [Mucilaginibacter sp. OK098]|uniref:helix-turn-helix domain-containing protein n=1 Tax=Mucilaginibacter sp. OK098 TaxID=1855297 RepID=UPI000920981B|nr:AraC family transcriptional regulator [Mucilaginibacter sp. OK098]SHN21609.1 Helix-turn-helix domain-containing protein [Mucilaginibacter sp. OK098]
MKYVKYKPDKLLEKHIDFYWVLQTDSKYKPIKVPLFADACSDIFINLGGSPASFNGYAALQPGLVYIGGVSTSSCFVTSFPDSAFVGIRFKPGGLLVFYRLPLVEIVDQIVEFQDKDLALIADPDELLPERLDQLFLSKKNQADLFSPITEAVNYYKGQISVDLLAQNCNISTRTLERLFYINLGISPKEFIGIVKFRRALKILQEAHSKGKLLEIALEMGYYDHAHLTREIKKHSGLPPSAIWPGPSFP